MLKPLCASAVAIIASVVVSCGTAAQQSGVGRACGDDDDCADDQTCLDFAGGYCGLEDCDGDDDCPDGSACVAHTDGARYCFLVCIDKGECNAGRSADDEANCSANVEFVDDNDGLKACVPPSGS